QLSISGDDDGVLVGGGDAGMRLEIEFGGGAEPLREQLADALAVDVGGDAGVFLQLEDTRLHRQAGGLREDRDGRQRVARWWWRLCAASRVSPEQNQRCHQHIFTL